MLDSPERSSGSRWLRVPAYILAAALGAGGAIAGDQFVTGGRLVDAAQGYVKSYDPRYAMDAELAEATASESPAPEEVGSPVVVIDPGHSGSSSPGVETVKDSHGKSFRIKAPEYANHPEIWEVQDVSMCAGKVLEADGYTVHLTKQDADDSPSLGQRAKLAQDKKADIAVSVHNAHGSGPDFRAVYDQRGTKKNGKYPKLYRTAINGDKVVFDSPQTAKDSQEYANKIAKARTEAEGYEVSNIMPSFEDRNLAQGNAWWVQILSKDVPWVYNEMGALTGGDIKKPLSIEAEEDYAEGLVNGIEAAVPITGKTGEAPSENLDMLEGCLKKALKDRPKEYRPQ
jgi:N-acetylmuramoyl-L-alanine amidase